MQVATNPTLPRVARPGLRIPVRLRRTLTQLTGQQFWLFGCDVRRPEGNVLAELGFCKQKAPGEGPSPSRYHLTNATGDTIVLWGFGLLWTDSTGHGVFLPRHRFEPRSRHGCEPVPLVWSEAGIPDLHTPAAVECPRCGAMVLTALDWLVDYERHVLSCRGPVYRDETIAAWNRPVGTAADLTARWQRARSDLASALSRT